MKMMKQILALVIASVSVAGIAQAGLQVGPYVSMAAADEEYGYGGGIRAAVPLGGHFLLDFRVSSVSYEYASAIPLELGFLGAVSAGPCQWYAGGGFGYYIYRLDSDTISDPDPELGFFAAGGISVSVAKPIRLFAEIKYTSAGVHAESGRTALSGGGSSWTSTDRGLDGIGANLGLLFVF